MNIYDSQKREKVQFLPIAKNEVKIYVCGATVYDDAHLGHARSSIVFDLLRRVFVNLNYKVTFVKNFTDIDDKIILKMQSENKSLEEITNFYIDSYKSDMHKLNVLDADIEPKATENLDNMIEMIQNLLDNGVGYGTRDGIYFDTSKDEKYLTLSGRSDEYETQARVCENIDKKNQKDFVLWKFSKDGEPSYKADFGDGRPGWHIECSAMIKKHLATKNGDYQIDIHGGGMDLLFPHHENESAQSRCDSGVELAKYWMHNGFVNINGEKMSKSLRNSFFVKDALKIYNGEVLRFYLLSTHYRANMNFNEEDLLNSKKRLDKIYRLKKRIYPSGKSVVNKNFRKLIMESLSDDLNISKTLASIDEMISKTNDELDSNPKNKGLKKETMANIDFIQNILAVGGHNPYEYFQFGIDENEKDKIENLITARNEFKKDKNFAQSDKIRDELEKLDIKIMDTAEGTLWEKI